MEWHDMDKLVFSVQINSHTFRQCGSDQKKKKKKRED